jgi:hypothetical protein
LHPKHSIYLAISFERVHVRFSIKFTVFSLLRNLRTIVVEIVILADVVGIFPENCMAPFFLRIEGYIEIHGLQIIVEVSAGHLPSEFLTHIAE